MNFRQISESVVAHRDLQSVAVLNDEPDRLAERLGIAFEVVVDDLDTLLVAAIETGGVHFLLFRGKNEPTSGTNVQTPDAGSPIEQLRILLAGLGLDISHVKTSWNGTSWSHHRVASSTG